MLDKLISLISPHHCVVCSDIADGMCKKCMLQLKPFNSHNCILCGYGLNTGNRCCSSCELANVNQLITVKMSKDLRKLLHEYKYNNKRAFCKVLAQIVSNNIDNINNIEIVIDKKRSGVVLNKKKLAELKGVIRESENFYLIDIPNNSHIVKLLERIRDESHRFAVSYHTVLKRKGQTEGILEEIPGIGPKTRSKLIRKFGSVSGVINADLSELSKIIPRSKAEIIKKYLGR